MTLAKLIMLVIQGSIFLTVFSLGLHATLRDAVSLWHRPRALFRSLLAMYIIMPLFAVWLARTFHLDPAVEVALLVLAVSPIPPILPTKGAKVGAHSSYVFGLLVGTAVLSVVVTPIAIGLLSLVFGAERHVPAATIAFVVMKTVLVPLSLGMMVRRFWPATADRVAGPIGKIAMLVLLLCVVLLFLAAREKIGDVIGNGTIVAIAAFVIVGLMVGQMLGGSDREDSTFLAIATASRHPGVAFAIANSVAPDQKLVIGVLLLYLLVNGVIGAPYSKWRKRGSPAAPAAGPLPHPSH